MRQWCGMAPLSERPAIMSAFYGGARVAPTENLDDLHAILLEPQPRPSWEHVEEVARSREPTAAGRAASRPLLMGTAASIAGAAAGAALAGPIGAAVGSKTAALAVVAGAGVGAFSGQRVATSIAGSKRELQLQEVTPRRESPQPGEQLSDAAAASGLQSFLPRTREAASSAVSALRGHAGEFTQRLVGRGYTAPSDDGKAGT